MFPDGLPGTGLLLLRAAAGGAMAAQGAAYFANWHEVTFLSLIVGLLEVASGLALMIGSLTPVAGSLAVLLSLGGALSWFPAPALDLFATRLTSVFGIVMMAALVCLGPGAFSLDARLFGRREIIIPSSPARNPDA